MASSKRKGRTPKIQEAELKVLRALVTEQPMCTTDELRVMLQARCDVSVTTVTLSSALKRAGIKRVRPAATAGFVEPTVSSDGRYGYKERHRDEGDIYRYGTSLTNEEWSLVADVFERDGGRGKPSRFARRDVVDACCYAVRTGCSWRLLPKSFPPWNAVYKYFRRWSEEKRFEAMHDRLRDLWRVRAERAKEPTLAILDSQSTRTSAQGGIKGFDAGKRVKGRKRNLVVDSQGLLLAVVVTAASVQDRDGARPAMAKACSKYPSLKRLFVDSAYAGACAEYLQHTHAIDVQVVRHPGNRNVGRWECPQMPLFPEPTRAYTSLPKRWIVERSHAWLERSRRLVMHHDRLPAVSEAWVWLSEARRLLNWLARSGS